MHLGVLAWKTMRSKCVLPRVCIRKFGGKRRSGRDAVGIGLRADPAVHAPPCPLSVSVGTTIDISGTPRRAFPTERRAFPTERRALATGRRAFATKRLSAQTVGWRGLTNGKAPTSSVFLSPFAPGRCRHRDPSGPSASLRTRPPASLATCGLITKPTTKRGLPLLRRSSET